MEMFMTDLILNPEIAGAIIEKITVYVKNLALESAASGIDVLCFYDDVGMQTGLQISPGMWRKYIKPSWKSVLETVRAKYPRIRCFLHSCGNIGEIVPDIVDLGFDILHPVQPECMDFEKAAASYGKDIVLCATISSQRTFPFGTPEDVREEVKRLIKICESGIFDNPTHGDGIYRIRTW